MTTRVRSSIYYPSAVSVDIDALKFSTIGVGRFRILGEGQGLEYWGAKGGGGGKFPAGT